MSFYRKYRPRKIEELDLDNVRASLYALSRNLDKIPQSFLFAGPRGSGKTSSARILAKLVNCEKPISVTLGDEEFLEPCNECEHCNLVDSGGSLDVIEVDAASNRGIDDIRALRESINLAPANAKFKFYIMDEAHMLTTEAANAFLKTLEEPPSHVIFVLATTDPQKLPETVLSRLTKINFRKAKKEEIKRQLARVTKSEKLEISEEVLDLIASKSDGSFRDAVKTLESLIAETKDLNLEKVRSLLDQTSRVDYPLLLGFVVDRDLENALMTIHKYDSEGGSAKDLIEKLVESFRDMLFDVNAKLTRKEILYGLKLLLEAQDNLRRTHIPLLSIEMFLAEWCEKDKRQEVKDKSVESGLKKKSNEEIRKLDELSWAKILSGVRERNASIEALLRAAKPNGVSGNVLNLGVYYRFHKERLETEVFRQTLEDVVESVLGGPLKVVCSLEEKKESQSLPKDELTAPGDQDIISAAKEIFGN